MNYYSQAGQDEWVHDLIGDKGFFVDVGAYDGVQTSNTYALEQVGWEGICVEANRSAFIKCKEARKCICVNKAVTDYSGFTFFGTDRIDTMSDIRADCDPLSAILKDNKAPLRMDYLSMDIEGHELTALHEFPFMWYEFKLMTIEHNLYCDGPEKKNALFELLTKNGYIRVVDNAPCLDPNPAYYMQPYEDWYRHKSFII